MLYLVFYIVEASASAFWSYRILENLSKDLYFYLTAFLLLGLFLFYIARGIYQVTGIFSFDDDKIVITDSNGKAIRLEWSQLNYAELEHVQGRFYKLTFGKSILYLKLGIEMHYELKSILEEKQLVNNTKSTFI